ITNNDAAQLANTKAGVIVRDGTAAGALKRSPLTKTATEKQQTRGPPPGTTNTIPPPTWVRVTRTGNSFAAYYSTDSTDGTNGTWPSLGTATTIAMSATAKVGLAVPSHTIAATATATFTNVTITQPVLPVAATPTFS